MKQRLLILITIFLLLIGNLTAQKDSLKNEEGGIFLGLSIDFPIIDNTALNSELKSLGYPACNYPVANFGIGSNLFVNRLLMIFSYVNTSKKKKMDFSETKVNYNSFTFDFGYDLIRNSEYSLYPYLGFKTFGLNYLYKAKDTNSLSFQNYFQTVKEFKEFHIGNANLDVGIGFSVQKGYSIINIRAGYLKAFAKTEFTVNNGRDELNNCPTIRNNFYFTLAIGWGGFYDSYPNKKIKKHRDN